MFEPLGHNLATIDTGPSRGGLLLKCGTPSGVKRIDASVPESVICENYLFAFFRQRECLVADPPLACRSVYGTSPKISDDGFWGYALG